MSRAGKRSERAEKDFYPTPRWCVDRFMEACWLPEGHWCEPCVGDGAIVRAVNEHRDDVIWTTNDIRSTGAAQHQIDFWSPLFKNLVDEVTPSEGFDVIITNPPFKQAMEALLSFLERARTVALLLRVGFLTTSERHEALLDNWPNEVWILPDRPSFDGEGSDASTYAWMVWKEDEMKLHHEKLTRNGWNRFEMAKLGLLNTTPLWERKKGHD